VKLSKLEVANCAWCPDLNIEVREHLVLVGPNQAGKSTVLRLLDALFRWPPGRLLNELNPSMIRQGSSSLRLAVELDGLTMTERGAFADEADFSDPERPNLRAVLELHVPAEGGDDLQIVRQFIKDGSPPVVIQRRHQTFLPWMLLSADRVADRELGDNRTGVIRRLINALDLSERAADLATAKSAVNSLLDVIPAVGELRSAVARHLSEVFPTDVKASEVRIGLEAAGDVLRDISMAFADGHSFLEQSDGMKSLAVVSLQLLSNESASITGIDEPEVHLHPRSQAQLASLLARSKGQRVVATHAPTVVQRFRPSHVVAILPGRTRQLARDAMERDPKFYERWWTEASVEPLTANGVIFVEGPSDAVLLRAVAQLRGIDLDRLGLSVVHVNSFREFTPAYRLFGPEGFDVPMFCLVDENEAIAVAKVFGVSVENAIDHGIVVSCPDLEGEYSKALGAKRTRQAIISSGFAKDADIKQSMGDSTDDDAMADFCRNRKVEASLAVAAVLAGDDKLPAIDQLLQAAAPGKP
jgi:putative ATP-dependent endonuclease of OLD family